MITWLSVVISLISIGIAIFIYYLGKKERCPAFLVDPVKTEILSSENVSAAPIKVIKKDGSQVTQDLIAVRFFFWNKGKLSIKPENILEPLLIKLSDEHANILDYKVLKPSRPVSNFKLQPLSGNKNILQITFDILEYEDGASCQLIYEGSNDADLKMSGIIEGVKSIEMFKSYTTKIYLMNLLLMLFGALIVLVFYAVIKRMGKKRPRLQKKISLIFASIMVIITSTITALVVAKIFLRLGERIDVGPTVPETIISYSTDTLRH